MSKRPRDDIATPEELNAAIAELTPEERLRLYRQGNLYALGTEFASGKELLGEAVKRALIGTSGQRQGRERGRPWPKDENIVGFLMGCMKSIGNGSADSVAQKVARTATVLVDGESEQSPSLVDPVGFHPSVEDELIERESAEARQAAAVADVTAIEQHFAQDQEVLGILEGEKDGLTAAETREILELTPTTYDTARRRLRRHVDKHFPGRMRK
ncbi:MAG: hypothetical protein K8R60_06810 [Burkholderiales bacterium]|nr:hypothetical protein [Burkholderiales bacterium]